MITYDEAMNMDVESFFQYVGTIRYGYQDSSGALHFPADADFKAYEYAFSSPEDVVENHCGWCWDIAELTRSYCAKNGLDHRSWFMEYRSEELHQTHTQVFLFYHGAWCPAPENSLGLSLGEPHFAQLEPCVDWFVKWFEDYLRSVLRDRFDPARLLVKEYTCTFPKGISDDEYLRRIRE